MAPFVKLPGNPGCSVTPNRSRHVHTLIAHFEVSLMFELLFKYPTSMFHKGQFVFLTPWPLWVMGIAILAAAAALFWHVHRNHGMLNGLRPAGIWVLQTFLVALILF